MSHTRDTAAPAARSGGAGGGRTDLLHLLRTQPHAQPHRVSHNHIFSLNETHRGRGAWERGRGRGRRAGARTAQAPRPQGAAPCLSPVWPVRVRRGARERATEGRGGDAAVRCARAHARSTHPTEGKTARRGRRRRRRQRARCARDRGAEQRPLARTLLRLPETRALAQSASRQGQAWRRGDARRRRRAASAPCAVRRPGEGAAGVTGQGSSPHPASLFEQRLWYACAGAAGRSVVGRGGAGRGPGARRRPRRRLGAASARRTGAASL